MKALKRPQSKIGWIAVLAMLIAAAAGGWYKAAGRQAETVAIADVALAPHDTVDDLMAAADLVVAAVPTGSKRNVVKGRWRDPDGWTLTEIRVEKIIKADADPPSGMEAEEGGRIFMSEPYFVATRWFPPRKVKIIYEDYTELKKGMRYVLFLKWSPRSATYGVYALHYGKYNIDGLDAEESGLSSERFRELKKEMQQTFAS
ncbi:MAG TPA: hypothetical protein VIL22_00340 [Paenibacillaceae bacterium]